MSTFCTSLRYALSEAFSTSSQEKSNSTSASLPGNFSTETFTFPPTHVSCCISILLMVTRVAPTLLYFDYTQGKLQMGSIEGRTLPIDYPKPDEKHAIPLRKHIRNDLNRTMCARLRSYTPRAGAAAGTREL